MTTVKQLEQAVFDLQKTIRSLMMVVIALFVLTAGYIGYKEFYQSKTVAAQVVADAQQPPAEQFGLLKDYPKLDKNDHIKGDRSAKYLLIEYSDFECPFCKQFHDTAIQFLKEYGSEAALVYRHYPLAQIHSKATDEAIASECVASLGGNEAFWKFAEGLFAVTPSNDGLDQTLLPGLAVSAGVDQAAFENCFNQKETAKVVEDQFKSGVSFGVRGTPGSFLINTKNGKAVSIPGALPYEVFKQALDKIK
ncbi:MAG: DsbA family protein [Candidatus Roizmanbacteria bacterium]|nr:DsbA family protein [Candidatus Roizmanbacteria bacterium]